MYVCMYAEELRKTIKNLGWPTAGPRFTLGATDQGVALRQGRWADCTSASAPFCLPAAQV